ncbi:MAG: hypothetical protein ABEH81_13065 [Halopenitus sp.]
MLLQTGGGPLALLGTLLLFAVFLSVTAHLAARNVLGDVDPSVAVTIGPLPAAVAVFGTRAGLSAAILLPLALLVDWLGIRWAYDQEARSAAYVTLIHFVVSVLLAIVISGVMVLIASRPG